MLMIYKIQKPIFSSDESSPILAYTEGRVNIKHLDYKTYASHFNEGEYKKFVHAEDTPNGFVIIGEAPWQEW
jgi:hypothetical protein